MRVGQFAQIANLMNIHISAMQKQKLRMENLLTPIALKPKTTTGVTAVGG